ILIAGTTAYDADRAALESVMAEWGSQADFMTRVRHLQGTQAGGLNGTVRLTDATVFDDGSVDWLSGESGRGWFLFNHERDGGVRDRVTDLTARDFGTDIALPGSWHGPS